MSIYQAPKPQATKEQRSASIALRLFFPPVLAWDLLQIIVTYSVGILLGKIILKAQGLDFLKHQIDNPSLLDTSELNHERHQVITHDQAQLDTLEIKHRSQQNIQPQFQKYIVYFMGNADAYERHINDIQEDVTALETNAVAFNYRGVSQSTGKPKQVQDLVNDGIAQVQRVLDQGVPAVNITLHGHSLGGGIASLVAQYFHQHHLMVNLFNNRSFSSLTNVLVGNIRRGNNRSGHQETTVGILLGLIAMPLIFMALSLSQWEIDAQRAYKSIPKSFKEYLVVRSRKETRTSKILDDKTIPHYASIHKALVEERRTEESEKLESKSRKMADAVPCPNSHITPLTNLKNRYGTTGVEFFRSFVKNALQDHGINTLEKGSNNNIGGSVS